MARGPYYTKEEDERLLSLWGDLKEQEPTFKEVAVKSVKYGICDRNPEAIAQHLSALVAPKVEAPKEEAFQMEVDIEKAALKQKVSELETKYSGLLHALIGCAELYKGNLYDGLRYNYAEITNWLMSNEATKFGARLEELQLEEQNK